jgi:hypothetical protein
MIMSNHDLYEHEGDGAKVVAPTGRLPTFMLLCVEAQKLVLPLMNKNNISGGFELFLA